MINKKYTGESPKTVDWFSNYFLNDGSTYTKGYYFLDVLLSKLGFIVPVLDYKWSLAISVPCNS